MSFLATSYQLILGLPLPTTPSTLYTNASLLPCPDSLLFLYTSGYIGMYKQIEFYWIVNKSLRVFDTVKSRFMELGYIEIPAMSKQGH